MKIQNQIVPSEGLTLWLLHVQTDFRGIAQTKEELYAYIPIQKHHNQVITCRSFLPNKTIATATLPVGLRLRLLIDTDSTMSS